jgi:hypothetical protein
VCSTNCPVRDLVVKGSTVFAGIDGPGGTARAYSWPSGNTLWDVQTDGDVDAVTLGAGQLLIGGHFAVVAGQTRKMFAVLDPATGALSSRTVTTSGSTYPGIYDVRTSHGVALLGGAFDDIEGQSRLAAVAP